MSARASVAKSTGGAQGPAHPFRYDPNLNAYFLGNTRLSSKDTRDIFEGGLPQQLRDYRYPASVVAAGAAAQATLGNPDPRYLSQYARTFNGYRPRQGGGSTGAEGAQGTEGTDPGSGGSGPGGSGSGSGGTGGSTSPAGNGLLDTAGSVVGTGLQVLGAKQLYDFGRSALTRPPVPTTPLPAAPPRSLSYWARVKAAGNAVLGAAGRLIGAARPIVGTVVRSPLVRGVGLAGLALGTAVLAYDAYGRIAPARRPVAPVQSERSPAPPAVAPPRAVAPETRRIGSSGASADAVNLEPRE